MFYVDKIAPLMSTLTVISGKMNRSHLSCGAEERARRLRSAVDERLIKTHKECMELSTLRAISLLKKVEQMEPEDWGVITFFTAFSSARVESISYIPAHLKEPQLLFATRGRWDGCLNIDNCQKFWERSDLRDITNFDYMEAQQVETAKAIVAVFARDKEKLAIAVAFKHNFDDGVDTYIWVKKVSFQ